MKMKKRTVSLKKQYILLFTLVILSAFTLLLATGCAGETALEIEEAPVSESENTSTVPDVSPEEVTQKVDHTVDMNPDPLLSEDEALSLEGYGAVGALNDTDLSISDMLMYAVQDEYLARGEYLAIMEKFGSQKPYSNIVRSEETHLAYLEEVYTAYDLEFPDDTSKDHLIIPQDLLEAAQTGVQAEIDNIAMYEKFMTYDLPENIYNVFDALKRGSDSHLLAFQKQVERLE
ncbi:MAG TPA: DUF2202 domain-containing protein [Proteiniclasticum sp.]|nr:DUF2202 domain-containing protein [Proteiniclasticum sp.]